MNDRETRKQLLGITKAFLHEYIWIDEEGTEYTVSDVFEQAVAKETWDVFVVLTAGEGAHKLKLSDLFDNYNRIQKKENNEQH